MSAATCELCGGVGWIETTPAVAAWSEHGDRERERCPQCDEPRCEHGKHPDACLLCAFAHELLAAYDDPTAFAGVLEVFADRFEEEGDERCEGMRWLARAGKLPCLHHDCYGWYARDIPDSSADDLPCALVCAMNDGMYGWAWRDSLLEAVIDAAQAWKSPCNQVE